MKYQSTAALLLIVDLLTTSASALTPDDKDYVRVVTREERINGKTGVYCLQAGKKSGKLVKVKKCVNNKKTQLWHVEEIGDGVSRFRPKSDPNICMYMPKGKWHEDSLQDISVMKMKKCSDSNKRQRWRYERNQIRPAVKNNGGLSCVEIWDSAIWVGHKCGYVYDDHLWDLVKPGGIEAVPTPEQPALQDAMEVRRGVLCLVGTSMDECQDGYNSGKEFGYNLDSLWVMDEEGHLRRFAQLGTCLGRDPTDYDLDLSKCMSHKDYQRWTYDRDGNQEISPIDDPDLCLDASRFAHIPRPADCNGGGKQRFEMETFSPKCNFDSKPYKKDPVVPYVHIVPVKDESIGLGCFYIDGDFPSWNGGCLDVWKIDLVEAKWQSRTKWLVEETKKGLRLRNARGGRGNLLTADVEKLEGTLAYADEDLEKEQIWLYNKKGNRELTPLKDTDLCLEQDAEVRFDPGTLNLVACDGSKNQGWKFMEADDYKYKSGFQYGKPDPDDFALVTSKKDTSYCVTAAEPHRMKHKITLAKCDKTNPEQLWVVDDVGGGKRLRPKANLNVCLDISRVDWFETLRLDTCDDEEDKMLWKYNKHGDNEITPLRKDNFCVTYDNMCMSSPQEGAMLGLLQCTRKKHQGFLLMDPDNYD